MLQSCYGLNRISLPQSREEQQSALDRDQHDGVVRVLPNGSIRIRYSQTKIYSSVDLSKTRAVGWTEAAAGEKACLYIVSMWGMLTPERFKRPRKHCNHCLQPWFHDHLQHLVLAYWYLIGRSRLRSVKFCTTAQLSDLPRMTVGTYLVVCAYTRSVH